MSVPVQIEAEGEWKKKRGRCNEWKRLIVATEKRNRPAETHSEDDMTSPSKKRLFPVISHCVSLKLFQEADPLPDLEDSSDEASKKETAEDDDTDEGEEFKFMETIPYELLKGKLVKGSPCYLIIIDEEKQEKSFSFDYLHIPVALVSSEEKDLLERCNLITHKPEDIEDKYTLEVLELLQRLMNQSVEFDSDVELNIVGYMRFSV